MAEAASRQLRYRGAARRDERHEHERHLVADTARRMLVDGRPADARRSSRSPDAIIAAVHVASSCRRQPLARRSPSAVPRPARRRLRPRCTRCRNHSICSSAELSPSRLVRMMSMTSRLTPAGLPGRTPRAAATHIETGPASVSTCNAAPPASQSSWRHRPHGASRSPVVAVDARERDEPAAARRVQRRHQSALRAQREADTTRSRRCSPSRCGRRRRARRRRPAASSTARTRVARSPVRRRGPIPVDCSPVRSQSVTVIATRS